MGEGIEHIAEDGNPAALGAFTAVNSGITYPASPGAWVVHTAGTMPLFTTGEANYGDGIEHIAEDGNPTALGASLPDLGGFLTGDVFNTPVGNDAPGPILLRYLQVDLELAQRLEHAEVLATVAYVEARRFMQPSYGNLR